MDAIDLFHAYMDASASEDAAQRDLSRVLASRDDFDTFAAYEDAVRAARAALTVAQGFARAAMQAYSDAERVAGAQILADRAAAHAATN